MTLPRYCPACCRTPVVSHDAVTCRSELRCPGRGTVLAVVTDLERAQMSETARQWLAGLKGA
jgi:hypothetical protein